MPEAAWDARPDVNLLQLKPEALRHHLTAAIRTLPYPFTIAKLHSFLSLVVAECEIQRQYLLYQRFCIAFSSTPILLL